VQERGLAGSVRPDESVHLARQEPVASEVLVYLNRLSDLLFVLARLANQRSGVPDVAW